MMVAKSVLGWALSAALSITAAAPAQACAFHGYTPNPTLVDLLLATEQVVFARPGAHDAYQVVDTALGPDMTGETLDVGAGLQARFDIPAASTVLLVRDGAYGPWMALAALDQRYRNDVTRILNRQAAWSFGGDEDRLRFFAKRVNDPSPDIRRLALQELDRADYAALKSVRLPRVKNLDRDLQTGREVLMPIRILLAGLSGNRGFTPVLWDRLDRAVAQDLAYLGAYATALIELEGASAVELLSERYLRSGASTVVQTKLVQALAIQYKSAPAKTRRAIAREVTELARVDAGLSGIVAQQFGLRGRLTP